MDQHHRTAPLASEHDAYDQHEGGSVYNNGVTPADNDNARREENEHDIPAALLPDIPSGDLGFDFESFGAGFESEEQEKIRKRASNLLQLSESNKRLEAEVKALQDRLEAAERRRKELLGERKHHIAQGSSS